MKINLNGYIIVKNSDNIKMKILLFINILIIIFMISIKTLNILDDLYEEASKSIIQHQLAAVICKGDKILSKPYCNSPKISSKNIADGIINGSIHAEVNAILNYYGKDFYYNKNKQLVYISNNNKKKIDIMVARFNKKGILRNARPCYNCLNLMKIVGIRKIYYTTDDGIICEEVDKMISIQLSASIRYCNNNKEYDYYNILLKNQFSQKIYKDNLYLFIKYNLEKLLPKYNYLIDEKNKYFTIYYKEQIILETNIY